MSRGVSAASSDRRIQSRRDEKQSSSHQPREIKIKSQIFAGAQAFTKKSNYTTRLSLGGFQSAATSEGVITESTSARSCNGIRHRRAALESIIRNVYDTLAAPTGAIDSDAAK